MVTVTALGQRKRIQNPAIPGEWTDVQLVTFTERGRGGANASLNDSTSALDSILGVSTGLEIVRTHTQAVKIEAIAGLPIGRELPLFINREMYSTPQMTQQVDVAPRMIGGKPTYFTTTLDAKAKEDVDLRLATAELLKVNASAFADARVGAANVQIVDELLNNVLQESTVNA